MYKKLFIAMLFGLLMFGTSPAIVREVRAQKQNKAKPNDKAKKLAMQGNQLFGQRDYRSAINKYAEAIVASPVFPEAHYWKGYAHYWLNEFDPAAEELDTAFTQGFKPLEIYKLRWYVNMQRQNYEAALADVRAGMKIEPKNRDFISGEAEILMRKGSYAEAIPALQRAIQITPNGDLHYYLALCYAKTGDSERAAAAADEAVKRSTKYTGEAYALFGDAQAANKRPAEAIAAYERALNVKPDLEAVYVTLADLYRSQSRLPDAIATAKKGNKLFPDNGDLLVGLTWYYSLADRQTEAVNTGIQAVKIAPNNYMAHTNLCRAYNDTKQLPQAINSCNNALRLNPNDGETNYYLGRAYDLQGNRERAAQYYEKAAKGLEDFTRQNPDYADGFYLLGNAYYADEQQNKAIEAYKKCLALSPNFARARYNLGYLYFLNKNAAAAQEQYDALVKIDRVLAEKLKQAMSK